MSRKKKGTDKAEDMRAKKISESAQQIKLLRKSLGDKQTDFANRLEVTQPMVSAWEAGRDTPSSAFFIRLGSLASYPQSMWFWKQAGMDEQAILSAAEGVLRKRSIPVEGEIIRVPRFRETLRGRESAGPPIPLPKEFVPNPASTVCFVVDKDASAVLDSPHAIFILDETNKNASNLLPFWGKVVFAEYEAEAGTNPRWRSGIYAGRLVYFNSWPRKPDDSYTVEAELYFITGLESKRPLELGWKAYPELKGSADIGIGLPPLGQNPLLDAARQKVSARAASELRLSFGWRILGHVIGRLSMSDVQNVAQSLDVG